MREDPYGLRRLGILPDQLPAPPPRRQGQRRVQRTDPDRISEALAQRYRERAYRDGAWIDALVAYERSTGTTYGDP